MGLMEPSTTIPGSPNGLPPFPNNITTAPLLTISLSKLVANSQDEHARLFHAARSLGFFYLDMRGVPVGERLLREANDMFSLMEDFFGLPLEEKQEYDFAAQKKYYGYKGMGKEVVDGKGTKDRNEIYNVSHVSRLSTWTTYSTEPSRDSSLTIFRFRRTISFRSPRLLLHLLL
jgi:isopenicillin N synthase-like dioxygenase